jgi:transposase
MRGESLDAVSRDMQVPANRLSEWRERALAGAEGALKDRERDERDGEIERLKAKVGEFTMANELLTVKIDRLEAGRPFAGRRLKR